MTGEAIASPVNMLKYALLSAGATDNQAVSKIRPDDFNTFFARVGSRVAEELRTTECEPVRPRPPIVCSSAFRVHFVTLPELSSAFAATEQQ